MPRRTGVSLVECVAAVAACGLLLCVAAAVTSCGKGGSPGETGVLDKARNTKCLINLHALGQSLAAYSMMNNDQFPMIVTGPVPAGAVDAPLSRMTSSASRNLSPLGANAMQQVWPVLAGGFSTEMFHCPGDDGWTARAGAADFGWTSLREFSYGIQWPYEGVAGGPRNAAPVARMSGASGTLVIAADRNPGGAVGAGRSPSNHPGIGTNVLDAAGSTRSHESRDNSLAGAGGNDVYVNDRGTGDHVPQSAVDTVIVPFVSR